MLAQLHVACKIDVDQNFQEILTRQHLFLQHGNLVCGISYMKRIRPDRWAIPLQPPRNPRLHLQQCPFSQEARAARRAISCQLQCTQRRQWESQRRHAANRAYASSAFSASFEDANTDAVDTQWEVQSTLNSPRPRAALRSAKLSALHARLSLPSKLPLQTLARCLIDPSVDTRQGYNNGPLALIGQDLLGYYTTEWLLCHYPRLPMPILFAAQFAYVGNQTLAAMRSEWGVEVVAAPGPEVDPGLLQLARETPGNAMAEGKTMRLKDMPSLKRLGSGRRNEQFEQFRRGMSSRIVYDDEFGELRTGLPPPDAKPFVGAPIATAPAPVSAGEAAESEDAEVESSSIPAQTPDPSFSTDLNPTSTVETASASFIRALMGALYLHAGTPATKLFHKNHILSRHLPLHTLFNFPYPTRDLSRLCAREGFEPPVARLMSETGRLSRTPVFVVGVFSGEEKLGEGAGSSLDEARVRASAAALRSWYLYSPPEGEVVLPSEAVEGKKAWKPQMVDIGEIVT